MSKIKSIIFVIIVTVLHQFCFGLVMAEYIGCNDRPNCIGMGNKVGEYILSFPLVLASRLWQTPGQPATQGTLLLFILNSFLAAATLCIAVNFVLAKRANRNKR